MKEHKIVRITIHHVGMEVGDQVSAVDAMQRLQKFCQTPQKLEDGRTRAAWPDIPYHFIIQRDGTICEARDYRFAGDTNTKYNPSGHLLICLNGDLEKQPLPAAQYEAAVALCTYFCATMSLSPADIHGHKDYAETDCPGKNMYPRLPDLRAQVTARLKGATH